MRRSKSATARLFYNISLSRSYGCGVGVKCFTWIRKRERVSSLALLACSSTVVGDSRHAGHAACSAVCGNSCADMTLLFLFFSPSFGGPARALFLPSQPVMGPPRATKTLTRHPRPGQQWRERVRAGKGTADTGLPRLDLWVPRVGKPPGCCSCVGVITRSRAEWLPQERILAYG